MPDVSADVHGLGSSSVCHFEDVLGAATAVGIADCVFLWIIEHEEVVKVPFAGVLIDGSQLEVLLVGVDVHPEDSLVVCVAVACIIINFLPVSFSPLGRVIGPVASVLLLSPRVSDFDESFSRSIGECEFVGAKRSVSMTASNSTG